MPIPKTLHGLDPFEAVSALQKFIRRGMEREAMEMAVELSVGHFDWLLARLKTISHEDIGLAAPEVPGFVFMWAQQCAEWKKGGKSAWRLALANIVLLESRAKKSRLADHFQEAVFGNSEVDGFVPSIPDDAIDMHTRRGKAMSRGIEHFREVGCRLENKSAYVRDSYAEEAWKFWRRRAENDRGNRADASAGESGTENNGLLKL